MDLCDTNVENFSIPDILQGLTYYEIKLNLNYQSPPDVRRVFEISANQRSLLIKVCHTVYV